MNAEPHVHEMKVLDARDGDVILQYGDQTSDVIWRSLGPLLRPWNHEWRIRRKARQMVRKHNRESARAGQRVGDLSRINDSLNQIAERENAKWTG